MFSPCDFALEDVRAFLRHHGFPDGPLEPIIDQAVVNWVYFVGEGHVLRINKPHVETDDAYTESVAVPAARAAGINTPELLVFDDSRSILDTVVTVYERAPGTALGRLHVDQRELPRVYRELGAEVARIQRLVTSVPDPLQKLDPYEVSDLDALLATTRGKGEFEQVTADWIMAWIDRLRPAFDSAPPKVFCHSDLHAFNTLVLTEPLRLSCVIDWGDACWGDPSDDFVCVPVWAVPWMIEGYELEGGVADEAFVGRILWQVLGNSLEWENNPGTEPWAPVPSSFWANWVRLMRMELDSRWHRWLPTPP